jgi:hypothetical protein
VRVVYTGIEVMTYLDYRDLSTEKTLTVIPGQTYSIALASGRNGDPDFVPPGFVLIEESKPTRRGVTSQDTSTPGTEE